MNDKYLRWIEQHNIITSTLASMRESEVDREGDNECDGVQELPVTPLKSTWIGYVGKLSTPLRHN